jgi:hypothetical protein
VAQFWGDVREADMNRELGKTQGLQVALQAHSSLLGECRVLQVHLALHANGHDARLTQVVKASGGSWLLARTWPGGRDLEYRLKW